MFLRDVKLHETVGPATNLFSVFFDTLDLDDKVDIDFLNQSLWSLFSIMAYDSVSSTSARSSTWDANLMHVAKFEQVLLNIQHMSHIKSKVLDYLIDNELPAFFFTFLTEIKDAKPSKKFVEDGKKITKDEATIQIAYFGSRIWNRADEVRRLINGNLNPLWIFLTKTKSGSGHNFNAVIEGIRRCTWPMEAITRATNNTKTARARYRLTVKKGKAKPDAMSSYMRGPNDEEGSQEDTNTLSGGGGGAAGGSGGGGEAAKGSGGGGGAARGEGDAVGEENETDELDFKEVYAINFKKVFCKIRPNSYYPTYWLVFLILGRPAGNKGRPPLEAGFNAIIYYILPLIS